jgi:hypothetical protein
MDSHDAPYPLDVSDEEFAAGFEVREAASGVRAVMRELGDGVRAVKARTASGRVGYALCDASCNPLHPAAESLRDLDARLAQLRREQADADAILLRDNVEMLLHSLGALPRSVEARTLVERARACVVGVDAWRQATPSAAQRAAAKRELVTLVDAANNLRSRTVQLEEVGKAWQRLHDAVGSVLAAVGGPLHQDELRSRVLAQSPADDHIWHTFLASDPSIVVLADGRVCLLPRDVPGGEAGMKATQAEVVLLLRVVKQPLTLLDLTMLLRYRAHASATWDVALLRAVLSLDRRVHVRRSGVELTRGR